MFEHAVGVRQVGGVEVRLDPSLLVLAALVAWVFTERFRGDHPLWLAVLMAIIGAGLVVATTLAHELGHAFEARHRGVEVLGVTLLLFGGATHLHARGHSARDELAVALVGPYVSLVCGAGFGILATVSPLLLPAPLAAPVADLAGLLGWWNVLLAGFNLVPGAPLDGGRVLRAVLWMLLGDRLRASTIAVRLGKALGVGLVGLAIWFLTRTLTAWLPAAALVVLGGFLFRAAAAELAQERAHAAREEGPVPEVVA